MNGSIVLINLAISIALILILTLKLKLNAVVSLIIASLYMGIASGVPMTETASTIGSGFGSTMSGMGLSIAFGVILGQLLSDCGGAYVIADKITSVFPENKALAAIAITAFVLSIPVFFDVTFVILIPIGLALAKKIKRPLVEVVSMIVLGAGTAHTLVPPTPNPLAAGEIFGFDVGMMIIMGTVVGGIACFIAGPISLKLVRSKKYWNDEKDINPAAQIGDDETPIWEGRPLPSFGMSMLPLLLPIVLILIGTCSAAMMEEVPAIISFLQNKIVALLLGALAAYFIAHKSLNGKEMDVSVNKALKSCGIVLVITGAGGSFGAIIKATGIADIIQGMIGTSASSVVPALLVGFLVAMVLRLALGSGTVASITAMNIMAPIAALLPVHPVYVAIACLAGGSSFGHVNDSGFWVVTNLSGFNVTGGLKTYCIQGTIKSFVYLVLVVILAVVLPMPIA